jgi:succinoglycan biosynthesis transport protein ExoP
MNSIEPSNDRQLIGGITPLSMPVMPEPETDVSLFVPILRRWYVVLLVFIVLSALTIPAVWLLRKPVYQVQGAIWVVPIQKNIITGEADRGEIGRIDNFMNTQARIITSNQIVQWVADDLADKNLKFFEEFQANPIRKLKRGLRGALASSEPAAILKEAVNERIISAAPERGTELIMVTMENRDSQEACKIVDAFINRYMNVEVANSTRSEGERLRLLQNEQEFLSGKLKTLRSQIRAQAEEYGSKKLDTRQEMKLERASMLLSELTKFEALSVQLEARVSILKQQVEKLGTADATEELELEDNSAFAVIPNAPSRYEYINRDPFVAELTSTITKLEQGLMLARQSLAPTNPDLEDKVQMIENMKKQLEDKKQQASEIYDDMIAQKTLAANQQKLINAKNQLALSESELMLQKEMEARVKDMYSKVDTETIEVGRRQLEIDDLQDQVNLTRDSYDRINRRIQELEMELKQPARIKLAYNAEVAAIKDKRVKLSAASAFASMAAGVFLAFLMAKADHNIYKPDDLTKRVGVRIIGTTTRADSYDVPRLPEQIAGDYQTIRANLGLLDGGGIPHKLVVTSAGMQDGKTTFAVNLATSLGKAGKRVLLIDGDLRKPDIRHLLHLSKNVSGFQDVIWGKDFDNAVYFVNSGRFDVLTSDSRNTTDAFEVLSMPKVSELLDAISEKYEHVIIDTPPLLAFPDALLLAKMADGVILTSFAGRTDQEDLKDALERLRQAKINVLGTVLNSVRANYSYNRYGYGYYADRTGHKRTEKKSKRRILMLPPEKESKKAAKSRKS